MDRATCDRHHGDQARPSRGCLPVPTRCAPIRGRLFLRPKTRRIDMCNNGSTFSRCQPAPRAVGRRSRTSTPRAAPRVARTGSTQHLAARPRQQRALLELWLRSDGVIPVDVRAHISRARPAGMWLTGAGRGARLPAATWRAGSAGGRSASTQPAEPVPRTMSSNKRRPQSGRCSRSNESSRDSSSATRASRAAIRSPAPPALPPARAGTGVITGSPHSSCA